MIYQRSRHTRGGTLKRQTTPANRDHLYPDSLLSTSGQFEAAELILISVTKLLIRRSDQTQLLLFQMAGDVHTNPGPASKYPCPVSTSNVTSLRVSYQCNICSGWVHSKCCGLLCSTVSEKSRLDLRSLPGLNDPTIITSNPCSIWRTN